MKRRIKEEYYRKLFLTSLPRGSSKDSLKKKRAQSINKKIHFNLLLHAQYILFILFLPGYCNRSSINIMKIHPIVIHVNIFQNASIINE